MALLNGHEVRHRAAELAPSVTDSNVEPSDTRNAARHIAWAAQASGIPVGTLHNATRDHNPQGISLGRVYDLAAALRRPDETDIRTVVAAIIAKDDKPETDDDEPEPVRDERPRDPSGPPNRNDPKGPPRAEADPAELRRSA